MLDRGAGIDACRTHGSVYCGGRIVLYMHLTFLENVGGLWTESGWWLEDCKTPAITKGSTLYYTMRRDFSEALRGLLCRLD